MMKRAWFLSVLLFVTFLIAVSAVNLLLDTEPEISEMENRRLSLFPETDRDTLFSGACARQFEAWFDDHFLLRSKLIRLERNLDRCFGIHPETGVEIVRTGGTGQNTSSPAANVTTGANVTANASSGSSNPTAVTTESAAPSLSIPAPADTSGQSAAARPKTSPAQAEQMESHDAAVAAQPLSGKTPPINNRSSETATDAAAIRTDVREGEEIIDEIIVSNDQAWEILTFSENASAYYADTLNRFRSGMESAVPVSALVMPSRLAFSGRRQLIALGADQEAAIEFIYHRLDDRIICLDAFVALQPHTDEYIYFRTDHHWTARGAWYLYREYMRTRKTAAVGLEAYETGCIENFVGSLYLMTLKESLKENPDKVIFYEPFLEYDYRTFWIKEGRERQVVDMRFREDQNKYQIFISSDSPLAVIKTKEAPQRKILVIKDSYGNALIPFLMPHYNEIHIIDPRYFEENLFEYTRRTGIDEVLFIVYFAVVGNAWSYTRNLNRIMDLVIPDSGE